MKKFFFPRISLFILCLALQQFAVSQNVGINSTGASAAASAMLDITSTNKGLLIPRIALTGTNDVATIPSAATSLLVYNIATVAGANAVTPGYYSWSGAIWLRESGYNGTDWNLAGNVVTAADFIGTTNNFPLNFKVNNVKAGIIDPTGPTFFGYQAGNTGTGSGNSGFGFQALIANTSGNYNSANGYQSLYSNTSGSYNSGIGYQSLYNNTTAYYNTAIGYKSLYSNTTGYYNTANGFQSLYSNTTGQNNTASGWESLGLNTTGNFNTSNGYMSLHSNVTGIANTASGSQSLYSNTTGNYNNANGYYSLYSNTSGSRNNAIGYYSLYSNTTGSDNNSYGYRSLFSNTTGFDNTASGYQTLYLNTTGNYNNAYGNNALSSNTTGSFNSAYGNNALQFNTTANYNSAFGNNSLIANTVGSHNVASGTAALFSNTTGSMNIAAGYGALLVNTTGYGNVGVGGNALSASTTGSNNVAVGYLAGGNQATGSSNTYIGAFAVPTAANFFNSTAIGYAAIINASNKVQIGDNVVNSVQLGTASNVTLETGLVKLTGGSPGTGKVLVSDAVGLASWASAGTGAWSILGNSGTVAGTNFIGTTDAIDFVTKTNNTERMRVYSAGNILMSGDLGIGVNSNTFRRATRLTMWSDAFDGATNGVFISNSESEEGGFWANGNYAMIFNPGDNDLLKIVDEDWLDNAGSAYDASAMKARVDNVGAYFQVSDRNAKTNIVPIQNALTKLNQISGYTYEFTRNEKEIAKGQKPIPSAGVLAQEVEKILPEAVSHEDGQYMVNYSAITPLLIQSIKEQQMIIEDLKKRIEVLETKK